MLCTRSLRPLVPPLPTLPLLIQALVDLAFLAASLVGAEEEAAVVAGKLSALVL